MPTLIYNGTAVEFGTINSATVAIESEYFIGINLKIVNSAPRPDGIRKGAQAVALRVSADKAAFYNCKIHGFQDIFCDDYDKHLYKDCYVEGTMDFIFGRGRSLCSNTETHVIHGDTMAIITAQAITSNNETTRYVFAHCKVTGTGKHAYLGRAWMSHARVIYAYSELSDVINPAGWFDNLRPVNDSNKGSGATIEKRESFFKERVDEQAQLFLRLSYIEASKWLLPPFKL